MSKELTINSNKTDKIAVDVIELAEMLHVGRNLAKKVGEDAGARIKVGRRTIYNVAAVKAYINSITEGSVVNA